MRKRITAHLGILAIASIFVQTLAFGSQPSIVSHFAAKTWQQLASLVNCQLQELVGEPQQSASCDIELGFEVYDATCFGLADGSIDMTFLSGIPPFEIDWDNNGTGDNDDPEDLSMLALGTYSVTVTDGDGCIGLGSFDIYAPDELLLDGEITNVSTNGGNDGAILLLASGGTLPYTFDWDNDGEETPDDDDQDLVGVEAGTYNVTVTDANGCSQTASFQVEAPNCDLFLSSTAQSSTCQSSANGSIDLLVEFGTPPYSYDWSNDGAEAPDNDPEDLSGLPAGSYTVTVTDDAGCTATLTETVGASDPIDITGSVSDVTTQGGNDGYIDITVSGGLPPFTFDWSNDGPEAPDDDFEDVFDLVAGTYTVTVTDESGCMGTSSFDVNAPLVFDLALRKTLSPNQSPIVQPGDLVKFTITIFNQGQLAATNILVIDYVPTGMTFSVQQNTGWTNFGAGPVWFISNLAPGATLSKEINLNVSANLPNGTVLRNYVEISAADDADPNTTDLPTDIDSSPNAFPLDDPGGLPGSPADDVITGDGTGLPGSNNPATDEDDHDGAAVEVNIPSVSLGNLVFLDLENDGIFNNNDVGLGNVEVEIYDAGADQELGTLDDQFIDNQLTTSTGQYLFTGLPNGFYYVVLNGNGIPFNHFSSTGDGIYDMDGAGPFEPAFGTNNNVDDSDDGTQIGSVIISEIIELSLGNEPGGNQNATVDFGLYEPQPLPSLTLGNLVFLDFDNDGVFSGIDAGIEGVEVELWDAGPDQLKGTNDDWFIESLFTGLLGEYYFTNLSDGFYYVVLNGNGIPFNHFSSTGDGPFDMDGIGQFEPAIGVNDDIDDNDDGSQMGASVMSEVIELVLGSEPGVNDNYTVDFGFYEPQTSPTLTLGNLVFLDYENDGIFNNSDTGIEGVEVELWDAGPDQTKGTNDDELIDNQYTVVFGEYFFTGLSEGFYYVVLNGNGIPANHVSSTGDGVFDNDGAGFYEPAADPDDDQDDTDDGTQMGQQIMSGVIELTFGNEPFGFENHTVDFGLYEPAAQLTSLGDFVWFDENHNGQQDPSESGVAGVIVALYGAGQDGVKGGGDDYLFDLQTTLSDGIYLFQNIPAGIYYVLLDPTTLPANYHPTAQNQGNDATDSDADAMGMTAEIALESGVVKLDVDFGLEPEPASLGNFVWQDYNGDNLQNPGEPGVAGITVHLFDTGMDGVIGNDDNQIATDITDSNGAYGFNDLDPGSYHIVFDLTDLPAGFYPVSANVGANDDTDSDANAMGATGIYQLAAGEVQNSVDFGVYSPDFDLSLTKNLAAGQSSFVNVGDEISYTIQVTNQGDNPAYNVSVVDHLPTGMLFSPNNTGWNLLDPQTAETTIAGPIMPGQSVSLQILMIVQYGAAGATMENMAEIAGAWDINGNPANDTDSTPYNAEPTEDDLGQVPIELMPHDPTGWIYCDKTGRIIAGGTISVTGPNGIPNDQVIIIHDGSSGYYEFYTDGTPGTYVLDYSHPAGYPLSSTCNELAGPFDPTGLPNPVVFGVDTLNASYLSDADCASNLYYLSFEIEPGDPNIYLNNLPVSCVFISATVSDDTNFNDAADPADMPIVGTTVYLYDCADLVTPIATSSTDSTGRYEFDGLVAGDYVVGYPTTPGIRFVSTGPINQSGFSNCISLTWGECDTVTHIGRYACPTINVGPDIDHCSSANASQLDANLTHGTGNFTWTPPTGLSNPNIENPIASPAVTTNYIVNFNDGFGCVDSDTIRVTVGSSTPYLSNMPFTDTTVQCAPLPSETPVFADDCDPSLTIVADTTDVPMPCGFMREITWVATNDEGNTATFTQMFTVQDTQAPTLTASHAFFGPILHGDTLYADCSMIPSLDSIGFASFDNCGVPTVNFTEYFDIGNCPVDGYLQIMHCGWTSTDACGNVDSLFFTVIIYDNLPPVLSPAPANLLVSCSAIPPPAMLTATDNCAESLNVVVDEVETMDANGCTSQIIRTWTVEDYCGNTASASQIITVFDNQNPSLVGVPANTTLNCSASVPAPPVVTATDNCDNDVPVTFNQFVTGDTTTGCYAIIRNWTATDNCGNTASATQNISISDTTPPTLVGVPADTNLSCQATIPAAPAVTATDACDSSVPVTMSQSYIGDPTTGCFTLVRTWTATDDCGNTGSASQNIVVFDNSGPVLAGVPADLTIACGTPVPAPPTVTATDNCHAIGTVSYNQTTSGNPSTGCYVITRTWSASDPCGNTTMDLQVITVEDTIAPTLSAQPADLALSCASSIPVAPVITATDNCDGNVPVILFESPTGNPAGCNYQLLRIWAAADDCGNAVTWTQTITVNDTVAPVLVGTIPANTTIDCGAPLPAPPVITATDNCDASVTVTMTPTYFGDPATGCYILTRTWTATDDCGNSVSASQDIMVRDLVPPNFVGLPNGGTVSCDNIPGSNVTATDNCDATVTVVVTDNIQSSVLGCVTQVVRTWTATDACGNTRIASRTYTVVNDDVPTITITAPGMTGVQDGDVLFVECDDLMGLSATSATASSDCCGAATVTFHETVSAQSCQNSGYLAVMNCGWIATDCCGNSDSLFFTVYVFDNTPPELIGVPDSLVLPVGSPLPAPPIVFSQDNCDNTVPISYNSVTTGPSDNQLTTRTWTAADDCGNIVTEVQTILITNDNIAPLIANVPPDVTIEGPIADAPSPAGVTATDNLDPDPTLNMVEERSGGLCCYTITRTWTATDDFGNSSQAVQTISVVDTQAPIIVGTVADFTGSCSLNDVPMPQLSATDNCTANLTAIFSADTTQLACGVQVVRNWAFTDECGNSAFASQTITLEDAEAPVFDPASEPSLDFFASQNTTANGGASLTVGDEITANEAWSIGNQTMPSLAGLVTDNCTAPGDIVFKVANIFSVNNGCEQVWSVAFDVLDACGNVAAAPFTVTAAFVDDVAPAFASLPQDLTVSCGNVPAPLSLAANDMGGGAVNIAFEEAVVGTGCPNAILRTWTATDACGNSTVAEQSITVTDSEAPVIANVPANAVATCGNVPPAPANVVATDNCGGVVPVIFNETISGSECSYSIHRTWMATDACGNSAVRQQYVWVVDNTAPTIADNLPAVLTVSCENGLPPVPIIAVSDDCDDSPTVSFVETVLPGTSCSYSVRRTWTVSDHCGNSKVAEQTVHVVDNTLPTLANVPADLTVNCGEIPAAPTVTANDNCDLATELVFKETNLPGCPAQIVRTWKAIDDCGNEAEASQIITVVDNQPPVLAAAPANLSVHCGSEIPAAAILTATDNCGGTTVSMQETVLGTGCDRTITRTWTATDACGNSASASQTIEVSDATPPVLAAAPTNLNLTCNEPIPAATALVATDNCDSDVQVNLVETTTATACGQEILRIWTATDDCGNSVSTSQLLSITDGEAPTAIEPVDLEVNCDELPVAVTPAFADNCDDDLTIQFTEIATPVACGKNLLRTWTATDNCGNRTAVDQIIHVTDLEAPDLTFVNPVLAGLSNGDTLVLGCGNDLILNKTDVLATDNCSNAEVQLDMVYFHYGNCSTDGYLVLAKYNWVATDECGNASALTLHLKVVDKDAPIVAPIAPVLVANCGEAAPNFEQLEVLGDCSEVTVDFASQEVATAYGHNLVGTWTATDICGNATTIEQTIQVYSIGAAQLLGVPVDVNVNLANGESIPSATVTAIDNCSGDALAVDFTENINQLDGCNAVIERTWSAVGLNGVTVSAVQTITVTDQVLFAANVTADSCNQTNGQVVLLPANLQFAWSDGETGSVRNQLAAGTYTVTATNANGCSATSTVEVEAACNCSAAVVEDVRKNIPVCGENKGKVVINLTQDEANYSYDWVPDLGVPSIVGNTRTNLPPGHYEVNITYASFVDCVTTIEVEVEDDCPDCGPIFNEEETTLTGPSGPTDICLPVPFSLSALYDIEVDGQTFTGMLEPCDARPAVVYNYGAVTVGGTYSIVWQHSGTTFYTLVDDMDELAAAMNKVNPLGLWFNDSATKELVSLNAGGNYGQLSVRHNATGVVFSLAATATISNAGTMLTLQTGGHEVSYTNAATGCTDEIYVNINEEVATAIAKPKEPGVEVQNVISPNGDGIDDYFKIDGLETLSGHELTVFDVLGRVVFRTRNYRSDWGGSWGQNNLPDGIYFYLLEDGKGKAFNGVLKIRR